MQPVEATIAKAQATEQFQRKILPSLGLGTDLESLAKYANDIANESTDKEGDLDLAEVDDDEIESVSIWQILQLIVCTLYIKMLLNPEEVNLKSKIWFEENGDYLKEQEGKPVYSIVYCFSPRRQCTASVNYCRNNSSMISGT